MYGPCVPAHSQSISDTDITYELQLSCALVMFDDLAIRGVTSAVNRCRRVENVG